MKMSKIWAIRMDIWIIREETRRKCPKYGLCAWIFGQSRKKRAENVQNMDFTHGYLDIQGSKEPKMSKT